MSQMVSGSKIWGNFVEGPQSCHTEKEETGTVGQRLSSGSLFAVPVT